MKSIFAGIAGITLLVMLVPTGGSSNVVTMIEIGFVVVALGGIAYEFFKGP